MVLSDSVASAAGACVCLQTLLQKVLIDEWRATDGSPDVGGLWRHTSARLVSRLSPACITRMQVAG